MYIADTYNHRIRKVTVATGIITTIAGTGSGSYSGDSGAATSAALNFPNGIALDLSGIITIINSLLDNLLIDIPTPNLGDVYIADSSNQRIRKVTISTGIISTIAGTGSATYSGDNGAATSAALRHPYRVTVDASGIITVCCSICYQLFLLLFVTIFLIA